MRSFNDLMKSYRNEKKNEIVEHIQEKDSSKVKRYSYCKWKFKK